MNIRLAAALPHNLPTYHQIRGERYDQYDTTNRTKQARHCT